MIITKKHLSRRTVLCGVGVSLALPLLDGMVPALSATRNTAAAPVRRFGAVYVGMGFNPYVWNQSTPGELQMNGILQPVAAFRDRMLVVAGLDSAPATAADAGQHPRAQAAWLTGCKAKKTDGPDIYLGTSLDQFIAREWGKETQLGSLELATEPTDLAGNCAYGFSCAYNNTLAWRTPTTPLPTENNPRKLFERLFGATDSTDPVVRQRRLRMNASILDSVREQVTGLHKRLGPVDRNKLNEYVDAVRDVERRIQKAEEQTTREMPVVEQPVGIPATFDKYSNLMFDLQLLAFQTDLTRIFTFVMARESSIRPYPEIGVPDSHHPLSHHGNNPEKLAKLGKLNAFHLKQAMYLIERMQDTPEGDGTLLDHMMLFFGSGLGDGSQHIAKDVPTLLVSGKGYGIKGNRFLRYPAGTPLANLQLTMLERLGLPMEQFGDSTGQMTAVTGV